MNKLDVFLAKNGMSPTDVVRYWLRTGVITLEDVFPHAEDETVRFDELEALDSEFHASLILPKKETLCQIKPGMFWYDDNTFSHELIEGKSVKSVVLAVVGNVVYGDTFRERRLKWGDACDFVKNFASKYFVKGEAFWPFLDVLEKIKESEAEITDALIRIAKPRWIGSYWSNDEAGKNYAKVVDMVDGFVIAATKEKVYSVRPVIKMIV